MSTTMQDLRREQWVDYFNALSARAQVSEGISSVLTVEVIGERPDGQQGAARWRLRRIAYKLDDDVLEIAIRGCSAGGHLAFRHFIARPRAITLVESDPLNLITIVVDDASGVRTRIRLFAGPQSSREAPPPGSSSPGSRRVIGAGRLIRTPIVGPAANARGQARDRLTCQSTGIRRVAREARRLRASPGVHHQGRLP